MDEGQSSRLEEGATNAETSKLTITSVDTVAGDDNVDDDGDGVGVDENDDIAGEECGFLKFAADNFVGGQSPTYVQQCLKRTLLPIKNEGDQLAALAVWVTLLRFMGDLPESKLLLSVFGSQDNQPPMKTIAESLDIKFSEADVEQAQKMDIKLFAIPEEQEGAGPDDIEGSGRKKRSSKKKSKYSKIIMNRIKTGQLRGIRNILLPERPTSDLEKVHFITGNGILRPSIRDEIYCQICKQLSQNPSQLSSSRGWVLMALCLGCFQPSEKLLSHLKCFLEEAPPEHAARCQRKLERILENGPRHQPPSWLELQELDSGIPLTLPVVLMDGNVMDLSVDSATTTRELCRQVAQEIKLKDRFGFSLYISVFDNVTTLDSDGDHVMDAVSRCEQYDFGRDELSDPRRSNWRSPWQLFFRKEIFTPWHDAAEDDVATELIYQQIVRGIKFKEYVCEQNKDLAVLTAQQYYLDHGTELDVKRLQSTLINYLPNDCLTSYKAVSNWTQSVAKAFRKCFLINDRASSIQVKRAVVSYALSKWSMAFSRFFEACTCSGPTLGKDEVIVAVNSDGVCVLDDLEQILVALSYPEIRAVFSTRIGKKYGQSLTLETRKGISYILSSPHADDIRTLIDYFLEGLRKRSIYAIVLEDVKGSATGHLTLMKGDLVKLDGDQTKDDYIQGNCLRTNENGALPRRSVRLIPTIEEPTQDTLNLYLLPRSLQEDKHAASGQHTSQASKSVELHTLERYSICNFRTVPEKTFRDILKRTKSHEELWRYSKEAIKQPLLRKLLGNEKLCHLACKSFLAVLKYVDHISSKPEVELTDTIFGPPLKHPSLRDEVYCQIVKQLTDNPHPSSEERAWQLLWLASGCFVPSSDLLEEVVLFLKSRSNPLVGDCLQRLSDTLRKGQRLQPPHQAEIEAIQERRTTICIKVYLPNGTEHQFDIVSATKARDLCQRAANKLKLNSAEGFSLSLKISGKVISVPEEDYFFDFLRHTTNKANTVKQRTHGLWLTSNKDDDGVLSCSYQVCFMKKLCIHMKPGRDRQADVLFHYHQELYNFLSGYYKTSAKETIQLAACIWRAKHGNGDDGTKADGRKIEQALNELLPFDLIRSRSSLDWAKVILEACNKGGIKNPDDAKFTFLKILDRQPLFGSAFFPVKQISEPELPNILLLAINKQGLHLINHESKDLIVSYSLTDISNWTFTSTYFQVTFGVCSRTNLTCETSLGYKMADLLTSYLGLVIRAKRKHRTLQRLSEM